MFDDWLLIVFVNLYYWLWNGCVNWFGWWVYFGDVDVWVVVLGWCDDLGGLVLVWIGVGIYDLFYDEDLVYVECLIVVGVLC